MDTEAVDGVYHCGKATPVALLGSGGGLVSRIFYAVGFNEENNNGLKCGRAGVGVC